MARYEFKLPDIGEGVAEAEIVEWFAAVGDTVVEGQPVASVMTQKATVELEAPVAGTIVERHGEIGGTLPVGALLMAFETVGEDVESENALPALTEAGPIPVGKGPRNERRQEHGTKRLAAPAVRHRAAALGIDLADVPATGDRVTHADLDRHITRDGPARDELAVPLPPGGIEIPLVGMRRQIARHMQEAKRRIPHFTYIEEVDVSAVEQVRDRVNADAAEGSHLGFLPFLVMATCQAVKRHPDLNARYDDRREVFVRYDAVHMGIATQTDQGLIVPVLRDADRLDLLQIAEGIARLAQRAREGRLGVEEVSGSTLTITSLGKLGGIGATPIVNWPEVAILAPGRIIERPVWLNGGVQPRRMLHLSISCDHRVVDGALAAAFVQEIKAILEAPGENFENRFG